MARAKIVGCRVTLCFLSAAIFPQAGTSQSPAAINGNDSAFLNGNRKTPPSVEFTRKAESLIDVSPVNRGEWGLLVVDSATGETLYERNADSYFVPASNMKLLTTALALDKLGADYRFRTTLETNGTLSTSGVLTGDLVLVGRGDPNLSNRKFPFDQIEEFDGPPEKALAELADILVNRGVKEISGDIVGDDSYFPRERYPDGWEIDDMVWEYGAAVSAIVVNDNPVTLLLTPGEKADLRLTREPGSETVLLTGTFPAKAAPRKLVLAIQEPAQFAATLLTRALEERGVKIRGRVRAIHQPDPDEAPRTVLAEHLSIPLADSVKLVNKISQNLHTELLLRTAARQDGRWANPDDLAKYPAEFYAKAGIAPDDVVHTDGSGLSRHDLVTPRAFVTLLEYAQKQPWFPAFFASLPIAGADGTLNERLKNEKVADRIHAKTGSVTHVRSLSGYADTPGGRRLIFSFLGNNQAGKSHEVQEALDGLCLAMIEIFNGPATPEKSESTK